LVVNVVGVKVLLEYASGTATSVGTRNWQQLNPQISFYKGNGTTRGDHNNDGKKENRGQTRESLQAGATV
jgi:hypothetical protein